MDMGPCMVIRVMTGLNLKDFFFFILPAVPDILRSHIFDYFYTQKLLFNAVSDIKKCKKSNNINLKESLFKIYEKKTNKNYPKIQMTYKERLYLIYTGQQKY